VGLGYQLMQLTASGHPSQQDKSINYFKIIINNLFILTKTLKYKIR
jgi:hypothetical protein